MPVLVGLGRLLLAWALVAVGLGVISRLRGAWRTRSREDRGQRGGARRLARDAARPSGAARQRALSRRTAPQV